MVKIGAVKEKTTKSHRGNISMVMKVRRMTIAMPKQQTTARAHIFQSLTIDSRTEVLLYDGSVFALLRRALMADQRPKTMVWTTALMMRVSPGAIGLTLMTYIEWRWKPLAIRANAAPISVTLALMVCLCVLMCVHF